MQAPPRRIGRYVLIGLGGIGGRLLRELGPFLKSIDYSGSVVVVDGDQFEERNRDRQDFIDHGPKASELTDMHGHLGLDLKPVNEYVAEGNVARLIREGDVVLLGVDNHQSRLVVSAHCAELDNVLLISGGNDHTDGNVMVYERRDGVALHPPIHDERWHPEIANPSDHNPADMGCEELVATGEPQLAFTNNLVAAAMLGVFYAWLLGRKLPSEVYVDLLTHQSRAADRPLEKL